jgi:aminopeptidase N
MKLQHYLSFVYLSITTLFLSQIPQIDVNHYKIKLTVSDLSDTIMVEEQIRFVYINPQQPMVFNLASRDINGKGMKINVLKLNGKDVEYHHEDDSLIIVTTESFSPPFNLSVSFKGIPKDGLVIGKNKYGSRTFFGDNWPTRAQNWFACNDHLSDKATVEFIVTAPEKYDVVANGKLISEVNINKTRSFHYVSSMPLPTKVMVVGVAELSSEEAGVINGTTVTSYVYPKNKKQAFYDFELAPSILQFYVNYIAPYEFEKLDNVQSTTRFGGMENAGCIFYDENALTGTRSSENLIAHEIVHQWFGNSATEKDWCHLWLSEGFATYLTNVYIEKTKGKEAFHEQLKTDRKRVISFEKSYTHPVVDTTYSSLMNLLNPNSYQKGGWVLHMLRAEIGDDLFHKSIREYYRAYRLSNADTRDFQRIVEEVTKRDLDWFFEQWLYTSGHPKLELNSEITKNDLAIRINQKEVIFKFPLKIEIEFKDGTKEQDVIRITEKESVYEKSFSKSIKKFTLDPEVQLLFEVSD